MAAKLISLSFKPSATLPGLDDLRSFLVTDFNRQIPGFTVVDTDAKWGDATISLVGKDSAGALVAIFPSVSRDDRDLHEVIARGMVAGGWAEENGDEIQRMYGSKGVRSSSAVRMILVAPAGNRSRAVMRALERAGVEVMEYSIYEIETSDGPVHAVAFDGKNAPAMAAPAAASAPVAASASQPERPREAAAPSPPEPRVEAPAAPPRQPSPVESFIAAMADPNLKAMSEQILGFLMSRFPAAEASVSPGDRGFTLNVSSAHLATIRLDKNSLWLEVGPEKIPTNKIKDPATLERAMNLPSVLEALQSVQP